MSLDCHFLKKRAELRLKDEGLGLKSMEGEVVAGAASVEDARAKAARTADQRGVRYLTVADYDPVLRAHCRLDEEG